MKDDMVYYKADLVTVATIQRDTKNHVVRRYSLNKWFWGAGEMSQALRTLH